MSLLVRGKVKEKGVENKKNRTFEDLVSERFAAAEDLVLLRNILIDKNIVIMGNKATGLPLLIAIICDVMRDELGINPYTIYETDFDYSYKFRSLNNSLSKYKRVIFQQISNLNTLLDAEEVMKKGVPVIACLDIDTSVPKEFHNLDYIVEMNYGSPPHIAEIRKAPKKYIK